MEKSVLGNLAKNREVADLEKVGGVKGIAKALGSSVKLGYKDDASVRQARETYGSNHLPERKTRNFLQHLIDALWDLTLIILIVAACITIIFGIFISRRQEDWVQGIGILFAVVVVSAVTSIVNWLQDREFVALAATNAKRNVRVIRGGVEQDCVIYDVVVGDILVLRAGEVLPCDCAVISGDGLKVSEASITGESAQLTKTAKDPFMVGGSMLEEGAGHALVLTTGVDTEYGRIVKALVDQESPPTPLQAKLDSLAKLIGYVGMGFGAATFILLVAVFFASGPNLDDTNTVVNRILGAFVIAITIVVVAVPEGLPLAVTISLAFSMRSMIADQTLVRELQSCETMGSATAICSDKTGTLTENKMTVIASLVGGRLFRRAFDGERRLPGVTYGTISLPTSADVIASAESGAPDAIAAGDAAAAAAGADATPSATATTTESARAAIAVMDSAILLNSDAVVEYQVPVDDPAAPGKATAPDYDSKLDALDRPVFRDNKTECAMVHALRTSHGSVFQHIRNAAGEYLFRFNFSSARKRMTTVYSGDAWRAASAVAMGSIAEFEAASAVADASAAGTGGSTTDTMAATDAVAEDAAAVVLVKGAAETLADLCSHELASTGAAAALDDAGHDRIRRSIARLADTGLRALAVCVRGLAEDELPCANDASGEDRDAAYHKAIERLEDGLVLVGIVGIKDPVRPEVPRAVANCRSAGIRVRMCTGDNIRTARFIARECGILPAVDHLSEEEQKAVVEVPLLPAMDAIDEVISSRAGPSVVEVVLDDPVAAARKVGVDPEKMNQGAEEAPAESRPSTTMVDRDGLVSMEGKEFRALSLKERVRLVPYLAVLARSSPTDKLLLVNTLKLLNDIVAVTGDGSNDAPALKAAHVGLAMGIAGTEVAKEASKVVILDDNFASIVRAVRWGRSVIENIRKFLVLQLTINVVALTVTFVVSGANEGDTSAFPLSVSQLLWINLLMDSAAALALATEPPSDSLLLQAPQGRASLITRIMVKQIAVNSIWQIFLVLFLTFDETAANALFFLEPGQFGQRAHLTSIFNMFVWLQLFAKLHARKIHDEINIFHGLLESKMALFVIFLIIVGQVIIVEFGGDLMLTTALTPAQWGMCILMGATSLPVGWISRAIPIFDADDELALRFGFHARPEAPITSKGSGEKEEGAELVQLSTPGAA
ncbi:hypothetical protein FNF31_01230 [Cafeteria roenbergensis]|uniref:P-type sodium-transporting ATPase4 n=1 Tax=Cafeteria roenbergensis TaxID=33653 RepID=A0A5A8DN70_CAFRO|nr:hypothetical protein FNF31_01230 [Cafeteria roenbergensis]